MSTQAGATDKPLRRDAERNRQRILEAAHGVFAERGLAATLDDVAAAAGVGVGTVYRRFPNKDDLIEALFEARIAQVVEIARRAAEIADPWDAFETFLTEAATVMAADRGMKEVLLGSGGRDRVARGRAQIEPIAGEIIERAQAAGVLRPDIVALDMPLIQVMLSTIADTARDVRPDLWRRYLDLILDGLRAEPRREIAPPPQPQEMFAAMSAWRPSKQR
jgi:AcrR family transcriptional regulator